MKGKILTFVDENGIPTMVQQLEYNRAYMHLHAKFFDGSERCFCVEQFCPSVGLLQKELTFMQYLQALNQITKYMEENWLRFKVQRVIKRV